MRISRRELLLPLAFVLGCIVSEQVAPGQSAGPPNPAGGITVADLEQSLKSGLKARRPQEFEFISLVVQKVQSNELPIGIVQTAFLWAKVKQPYPYVYFERALKELAAREGISL